MSLLMSVTVSLGKSSCAALERVIQQTEIMFRELGDDGGPGALLNLRLDYLSKKFFDDKRTINRTEHDHYYD